MKNDSVDITTDLIKFKGLEEHIRNKHLPKSQIKQIPRHTKSTEIENRPSLVVQWVRSLPGQGTHVPGPGRSHMPQGNYTHVLQPLSLCSRALELQQLKPMHLEPVLCNIRSHHNQKLTHSNQRVASTIQNQSKPSCSNQDPEQPISK